MEERDEYIFALYKISCLSFISKSCTKTAIAVASIKSHEKLKIFTKFLPEFSFENLSKNKCTIDNRHDHLSLILLFILKT